MAFTPFQDGRWASLWPTTVSNKLELEELVKLVNRRFTGKPFPPAMPNSASRSIWNDISVNTPKEKLIQLLNRRLGGIRIPMTEDALEVIGEPDPVAFVDENFLFMGRHDLTWWQGQQPSWQVLVSSFATWDTTVKRYGRAIGVTNGQRAKWTRFAFEPRAFGDPRYGNAGGYAMRLRECISIVPSSPLGNTNHYGLTEWGLAGSTTTAPGTAEIQSGAGYRPFVGFRAHNRSLMGAHVSPYYWASLVVDADLNIIRNTVSAVDGRNVARDLMLELMSNGTINWYVDNALIDTYTPVSGEWPGTGAVPVLGEWKLSYTVGASSGATVPNLTLTQISHLAPGTPAASMVVSDLP